jgi:hypothetical protein
VGEEGVSETLLLNGECVETMRGFGEMNAEYLAIAEARIEHAKAKG